MKILKYSMKFALFHVKPHRKIRTVVSEKCNSHSVSRSILKIKFASNLLANLANIFTIEFEVCKPYDSRITELLSCKM